MPINEIDLSGLSSAVVPWLALLLSLIGLYSSRKALRLSEAQEERQKPLLVLYQQEGYVRYDLDSSSRYFAFLLSVSNRSDADNAISEVLLRLTYTTSESVEMTVKIPSTEKTERVFEEFNGPLLTVPERVDAHQTVSGWCYFQVKDALLDGCRIERHSIAIIDSHGIEVSVEPIVVQEFSNED
ncbi:MAG: hypothetical protein OQK24_12970 [Magnetovibrio sp.]|nr:hypothetical protein [Magnetovibrio sp.]